MGNAKVRLKCGIFGTNVVKIISNCILRCGGATIPFFGDVFLRVGDETKKLRFEQRQDLEYDRCSRLYEDDLVEACTLDDLDAVVLGEYKKAVGYDGAFMVTTFASRCMMIAC